MSDVSAVVAAYWARYRLGGGDRQARLRHEAGEFVWAWDLVEEAVHIGTADVLTLLDSLLASPKADPCYLGAGPVEELLVHNGPRFDGPVAERCRRSELWREALACVWLDDAEEQRLPAVKAFLPADRASE